MSATTDQPANLATQQTVWMLYEHGELTQIFASRVLAQQYCGAVWGWLDDYREVGVHVEECSVITALPPQYAPYRVDVLEDGSVQQVWIKTELPLLDEGQVWTTLVRPRNHATFLRAELWASSEEAAIAQARTHKDRYIAQGRWKRDNRY